MIIATFLKGYTQEFPTWDRPFCGNFGETMHWVTQHSLLVSFVRKKRYCRPSTCDHTHQTWVPAVTFYSWGWKVKSNFTFLGRWDHRKYIEQLEVILVSVLQNCYKEYKQSLNDYCCNRCITTLMPATVLSLLNETITKNKKQRSVKIWLNLYNLTNILWPMMFYTSIRHSYSYFMYRAQVVSFLILLATLQLFLAPSSHTSQTNLMPQLLSLAAATHQ